MASLKTKVSCGDHVEHFHTKQKFTCEHCSITFYGKNHLEAHMLVHTGGGLKCEECGLLVTTIDGLRKHRRIHTGEKPYKCEVCDRCFSQPVALENHKRVHTKERPFVCGQCGARYTQVGNLRRHMVSHTGVKPFECSDCHRRFTEKASMKRHQVVVHTGDRPFSCDLCGCTFRYRRTLRSHVRKKHDPKSLLTAKENGTSFLCDLCGKTYLTLKKLNAHISSHEGKAFLCKICGKMFSQEGWYQQHLASHVLRRNPLECELCKRKFVNQHKLKRHQLVHTGERPYPCTECGARFGTKANLKIHTRIHTGEKPYVCHICGDAFSAKGNMTRHRSFHFLAATRVETGGILEATKEFPVSQDNEFLPLAVNQTEDSYKNSTEILSALNGIDVHTKKTTKEIGKQSRNVRPSEEKSSSSLNRVIWNSETARHSFWKNGHSTAVEHLKRKNAHRKCRNLSYKYRSRIPDPGNRSNRKTVKNYVASSPECFSGANLNNTLRSSEILNTDKNFVKVPYNSDIPDIKVSMSTYVSDNKLLSDAILSLKDNSCLDVTHKVIKPDPENYVAHYYMSSPLKQTSPIKTIKNSPSNGTATICKDELSVTSLCMPEIASDNDISLLSDHRKCSDIALPVRPNPIGYSSASDGTFDEKSNILNSTPFSIGSGFSNYCNSKAFEGVMPLRIGELGAVNASETLTNNRMKNYLPSDTCKNTVSLVATADKLLNDAILSLKDRISISIVDSVCSHNVEKVSPFRHSKCNSRTS